jgi:predicted MFS family arabinose efflux permease
MRRQWGKSAVVFPAALLFNLSVGLTGFGIIFYARDVLHGSAGRSVGWWPCPNSPIWPAARMAVTEAARTVGFVLGASGGGLLLHHGSFSGVLVVTAAAILLAAAVRALLSYGPPARRTRRPEQRRPLYGG